MTNIFRLIGALRTNGRLQAILLMLISMACFAAMSATIRLLSGGMHSTQIIVLRNIMSIGIVIIWYMALYRHAPRFKSDRLQGHFWRASIGFVAMELWFYSLTVMPLTLATALSFTTPIFSTIFAILFLGERAGIRRWSAIAVGFLGILVILNPDSGALDIRALYVLSSSAMMAIAAVVVKTLTRTEPPETIVFFMSLFMIPWSIVPAIAYWQPMTAHQLWLVFLIALFSTGAHLMMARAYVRTEMVVLMPFDFTRLIFTAMLAYMLFGEVMDARTISGSLIIVASAVYIAHREAKRNKEAAMAAAVVNPVN